MGYRKIPTIHTIEMPKYEGLVVRMKSIKIGKMRRVMAMLDDDDRKLTEVTDEMVEAVAANLVSWTLEDEEGNPLPATREEVEELELDMLTDILGEWLDRMTGPSDDLGKDSSAGEKFPGQPLTMEAL